MLRHKGIDIWLSLLGVLGQLQRELGYKRSTQSHRTLGMG